MRSGHPHLRREAAALYLERWLRAQPGVRRGERQLRLAAMPAGPVHAKPVAGDGCPNSDRAELPEAHPLRSHRSGLVRSLPPVGRSVAGDHRYRRDWLRVQLRCQAHRRRRSHPRRWSKPRAQRSRPARRDVLLEDDRCRPGLPLWLQHTGLARRALSAQSVWCDRQPVAGSLHRRGPRTHLSVCGPAGLVRGGGASRGTLGDAGLRSHAGATRDRAGARGRGRAGRGQ